MNAMMKNCRLHEEKSSPSGNCSLSKGVCEGDKASLVISKILAMKRRESSTYYYRNYVREKLFRDCLHENLEEVSLWREKICHWTYSVIDHFLLARKTVAISIDLFDRYLATQGNYCDGSFALLASLTTLYIAIKVHEKKKIKLSTLCELSRCQFESKDIEDMEVKILQSIFWLVHPPIVIDFTSLLLRFLPPTVPMPIRHEIFEHSRYMGELSVCDPVFMDYHRSTIAFASIINALEHDISEECVTMSCRQRFFRCLYEELDFHQSRPAVRFLCDRLQTMVDASGVSYQGRQGNREDTRARTVYRSSGKEVYCRSNGQSRLDQSTKTINFTAVSSANPDAKMIKTPRSDAKTTKSPQSRCSSIDSRSSMCSKGSKGSAANRFFRAAGLKKLSVTPC